MLTFKKGTYQREDLKTLHDAILAAYVAIPCNHDYFAKEKCYGCKNYRVCRDLASLLNYIAHEFSCTQPNLPKDSSENIVPKS